MKTKHIYFPNLGVKGGFMVRALELRTIGNGEGLPRVHETPASFAARSTPDAVGAKRPASPTQPPPPPPKVLHVAQPTPSTSESSSSMFNMSDSHALLLAMLLGAVIFVTMYMGKDM